MFDEVDFIKEAQNIETFRRYLSDSGYESVCTAPYVYRQMSTRRYAAHANHTCRGFTGYCHAHTRGKGRVLVMERLYGVPLTHPDVIKQATGGRDPQQILINAMNVWFGSILRASSFHADVHQGGHPRAVIGITPQA